MSGSSITNIYIDPAATNIGSYAFANCIIPMEFTIPQNVTSIGGHAFDGATLPAGFTIPSGVISIEPNTFNNVKFDSNYG